MRFKFLMINIKASSLVRSRHNTLNSVSYEGHEVICNMKMSINPAKYIEDDTWVHVDMELFFEYST